MRVLLGSVFSGAGCAGASLEPVMASMRQATGLTGLVANTVNIRLSEEFVGVRDFIFLRDEHQRHENVFPPTTRKDVTPLNRKPGGLMEQSNASLQRGDQG